MKISKKHSERMANKFKASRENLDTFAEEPRVTGAISAGTTSCKFVPSEVHSFLLITIYPSRQPFSLHLPRPHIFMNKFTSSQLLLPKLLV